MKAKTICWNGPVGWYENKKYEKGTKAIAKAIAAATTKNKAISIAGGGETGEAIKRFRLTNKFTHVSTGGGASLMLWRGTELPAVKALKQSYRKFKNKF
jgi:phosphoglycerate kinase